MQLCMLSCHSLAGKSISTTLIVNLCTYVNKYKYLYLYLYVVSFVK